MSANEENKALTWAKLLRLSLFPSALADPIAGAAVAGMYWPSALPELGCAIAASLAVYHGSMALNDWKDRDLDKAAGRQRPLTTGTLSAQSALFVGAALVLVGVFIPYFAPVLLGTPRGFAWIEFAIVAALATAYSFGLRGAFFGPLLLGLCRAGNFVFGALVVSASSGLELGPAVPICALLYFALIFTISTLGRYEDGEAEATPEQLNTIVPRLLRRQSALLWSLPIVLAGLRFWQPTVAQQAGHNAALFAACVAISLSLASLYSTPLRKLSVTGDWTPRKIESVMGLCLSRLVPFSILAIVATAYSWQGLLAAGCLHALAKLGRRMMAIIPPS